MASVIVISKLIHSELFLKHSSNAIKVLLYLLSIKNKYTSYDDLVKVTTLRARAVSAPGFETLAFLLALVAVVLIFKYKKKNRSNQK